MTSLPISIFSNNTHYPLVFVSIGQTNGSNAPVSRPTLRALTVYGKTVEEMQLNKYKRFSGLQGPESITLSVWLSNAKLFIVVFLFYNATALMLIPLLTF